MKKIKPTIIFIIFIGSFFIVSNILAMSIEVISPQFIIPGETRVSVFGRDFGEEFNYGTLYMEGTRITKANWTDTKISFNAPLDINPGRIEVKQSDGSGGYSEIVHSNYYYLQPAIDSFSPKSGAVGDIITIKGRNLENVFPKNVYPISMQIYVGGTTVGKQNILTWGNNKIVIKVPSGAKSGKIEIRIKADNSIVEIKGSSSENFKVLEASANDPLSPYQEYLHRVKIRDAWDYSVGTYDITVAVIDSGIYIHHPDLKDNIWKNTKEIEGNNVDDDKNGYIDDIFGWNFVDNNNQMDITFDKDDHGTMVAGIIGAKNNNYIGISGINKYVKLMPLLILSKYKSADFDEVAKAIKYAVDNGADIINLSFGTQGTVGYTTALDNAIKYAYENNVLLVAAAGNGDVETGSGQDLNFVKESPVCNDNNKNMVLGVGALSDNDFVSKTNWSNYGTYIDIWAPGENILTTSKPEYSNYQLDYFYGDGTSFAAPIVSGIAALIKAKYPDISNVALRDRIINSAKGNLIVNAYEAIKNPLTSNEKGLSINNNEDNSILDLDLSKRVRGRLLLQVEGGGNIWYVDTNEHKRYSVTWANALPLFQKLSLGITDADLSKIPIAGSNEVGSSSMRNRLKGKLLLQVQQRGAIWFVDKDGYRHSVTWNNLMPLFQGLALGITNNDLNKIQVGSLDGF